MDKALEYGDRIPIGLLYRSPDPQPPLDAIDPALTSGEPLVQQSFTIDGDTRKGLIREFM